MKINNTLKKTLLLFLFSLVVISCKKEVKENTIVDDGSIRYQLFQLEKFGWKSKKYSQKVEDIQFTATEVPIQYYLLKDQGNQDLFNIDSLYQENKTERILEFTFEQENEEDLLNDKFTSLTYEEGIKYMSFAMDNDFYVVTSKNDTIPCSGVNYERNFKIAPYQKVLLFFSGIAPDEKIQLIYNDKLCKKGILKFQFKDTYTEILL